MGAAFLGQFAFLLLPSHTLTRLLPKPLLFLFLVPHAQRFSLPESAVWSGYSTKAGYDLGTLLLSLGRSWVIWVGTSLSVGSYASPLGSSHWPAAFCCCTVVVTAGHQCAQYPLLLLESRSLQDLNHGLSYTSGWPDFGMHYFIHTPLTYEDYIKSIIFLLLRHRLAFFFF